MSDYRTSKPCCFCQRNEDELCDKGSEVCKYYKAYHQGRADAIDECIKTIIDFCGGLPNGMYVNALKQLKEHENE